MINISKPNPPPFACMLLSWANFSGRMSLMLGTKLLIICRCSCFIEKAYALIPVSIICAWIEPSIKNLCGEKKCKREKNDTKKPIIWTFDNQQQYSVCTSTAQCLHFYNEIAFKCCQKLLYLINLSSEQATLLQENLLDAPLVDAQLWCYLQQQSENQFKRFMINPKPRQDRLMSPPDLVLIAVSHW